MITDVNDDNYKKVTINTTNTSLHNGTAIPMRVKVTRSQSNQTANLDWALTLNNLCTTTSIAADAITIPTITTTVGVSVDSALFT